MPTRISAALATFLALVPVTLLVPGLVELLAVQGATGAATETAAHAFMSVNMLAGVIAVPVVMHRLRGSTHLRAWVIAALAVDAMAFLGMAISTRWTALFAFRVLDGAVHLPAVTLLMVLANRASGERRGGSLGALATAIMLGVAVGSPLGGWLVTQGRVWVYGTGVALLLCAAGVVAVGATPPAPVAPATSRYRWNYRSPVTWIPLGYGFLDRLSVGVFVSTFTLYMGSVLGLTPGQRGVLIALFMIPFALLCYPIGRVADRRGWFGLLLTGNVMFGLVFATYGLVSAPWLPLLMLLSGIASALMFAPNLLLISDLAEAGEGEGLFGAFQVAGSLGFLMGPIVGGVLTGLTRGADGQPAYARIFAAIGGLEIVFAALSYLHLREVAQRRRAAQSDYGTAHAAP